MKAITPSVISDALVLLAFVFAAGSAAAAAGFACVAKMSQQLTPANLENLITRTCLHLVPLVIGDAVDRAGRVISIRIRQP
ncbi:MULTISPECIES: hypothetical protein [unclassified Bradyrhizobium]|uniref:hypothetical protein n=1 Tax=unclassified Bradyrhizobium TaxID=2631580 RepID=UPI0028EC35CA|nr:MULTISPECIES: hypothetical protein [unclassified Bradyrhizobium]